MGLQYHAHDADTSPMTPRTALLALPLLELEALAAAAFAATGRPSRVAGLPRWLLVEVALIGALRAATKGLA